MGNRGGRSIATDKTLGPRRWTSKRWISCRCAFRGRRRAVGAIATPSSSFSTSRPRSPPATVPVSSAGARRRRRSSRVSRCADECRRNGRGSARRAPDRSRQAAWRSGSAICRTARWSPSTGVRMRSAPAFRFCLGVSPATDAPRPRFAWLEVGRPDATRRSVSGVAAGYEPHVGRLEPSASA